MQNPPHPKKQHPRQFQQSDTSWNEVSKWYDQLVGERGSDFHQQVVMPGAIRILKPKPGEKILDLACGQGVFSRELSKLKVQVTGVDAAKRLIDSAINRSKNDRNINYKVLEAQNLKGLEDQSFDGSSCLLAIQNIDPLEPVISELTRVTKPGGRLTWVLTHPCFRIPRQSGWGIDENRKLQYRRVDHYMTPLKIPIYTHPGSSPDLYTWTFHRPLSYYIEKLTAAGWLISHLEEWSSHKKSLPGKYGKAENRARQEIPLFMALGAVKK